MYDTGPFHDAGPRPEKHVFNKYLMDGAWLHLHTEGLTELCGSYKLGNVALTGGATLASMPR